MAETATKINKINIHLRPLHDGALVKCLEGAHQAASGTGIPDAAEERPDQGEVIAAGSGKTMKDGELCMKVGDKMLIGKIEFSLYV